MKRIPAPLLAALFLSGFCGISYEVLYARLLGNIVGSHFAADASILMTFLFGIGIGSYLAHRWRALWAVELGIGLFAMAFPLLARWADSIAASPRMSTDILMCVALLVLPALLIGMSLPLFAGLLKAAREVDGEGPGGFALAYLAYNLGAAATAFAMEFVAIRSLGIETAIRLVAVLNFLVAAFLLMIQKRLRPEPAAESELEMRLKGIIAIALASVASAIFQLFMLKIAEFVMGPFHETFALVLTLTLLGLAAGSVLVHFLRLEFEFVLLAAIVFLFVFLVTHEAVFFLFARYHEVFREFGMPFWKLTILFLLMAGASTFFGATIPAFLRKESHAAKESGRLLFVSSMANVAGYLLMVFLLQGTLSYGGILIAMSVLVLTALVLAGGRAQIVLVLSGTVVACAHIVLTPLLWNENLLYMSHTSFASEPSLDKALSSYEGGDRFAKYNEVFAINRSGGNSYFFINGYTSMPMSGSSEHVVGVLSTMVSRRTNRALVLGLGSGATAGTVAELFDHMDTVEISGNIIDYQPALKNMNFDLVSKPSVHIHWDDGIRFLRRQNEPYDLVLNTVTTPLYFSSSKLYTREFLKSAKLRMRPDGVYVTWIDSRIGEKGLAIILATLRSEFRYAWLAVIKSSYFIIACSDTPIGLHQEERATGNAKINALLRARNRVPESLRYAFITPDVFAYPTGSAKTNTLDHPVLEFEMSRLGGLSSDLGNFKRYLRHQYSRDTMNTRVFVKSPLRADLLRRYYNDLGRKSTWAEFFRKMPLGGGSRAD